MIGVGKGRAPPSLQVLRPKLMSYREGKWELLFNRYTLSVFKDESSSVDGWW